MKYHTQGKKQTRGKKEILAGEVPRYKYVIPVMLGVYMLLAYLMSGMEYKWLALAMATVGMIAWAIGEKIFPDHVYRDEKQGLKKWVYILLGIFLLMAVLSQLFAKDYSNSVLVSEGDTLGMIFGYIVLFYMAYRTARIRQGERIITLALTVLVGVVIFMSFLEFFDVSVACIWVGNTDFLVERNRVALTFGNSNYYGAFCCMLLPFMLELWIKATKNIQKLLYVLFSGFLMVCVLMSKSTMAMYLMFALVIGVLIYEWRNVKQQLLWLLCQIGVFMAALLIVNVASNGTLFTLMRISAGNTDAFTKEEVLYEVEDIQLDGNRVTIKGIDTSFVIQYGEALNFYDDDNQLLDIQGEDSQITFVEAPYNAITVDVSYNQVVGLLYLEVDTGYKDTIDFYIENGEFKGVGADGRPVEDISGSCDGEEWYHLFTGRGYIWLRTIEMLDEVLILGKGCGNFVHSFKQYDYVGLLKSQGTHNIIINRPHNMFLQYSVEIGIVGTVALFVFVAFVLFGWIYSCFKRDKDENILSVASFFAIVTFMIFALLNDSLISISPYFWIFLGINMAFQIKNHQ